MDEKSKKAVYAYVWTVLMMMACYLTASMMPFSATTLSTEATLLLTEAVLFAISLTILTITLKVYKGIRQTSRNT